jgi:adenylate kinase family enzyme
VLTFQFGAPHLVLFFQCPKDVVKDRVVRRGREGDTSETFDKRYEQYLKLTPPILAHYSSNDKLVEASVHRC